MAEILRLHHSNNALPVLATLVDQVGDLAFALSCFEKTISGDDEPCAMTCNELRSMLKLIRLQADQACMTLGSYMIT